MGKLATQFTPVTLPDGARGMLLFDPLTGERQRLTITEFFELVDGTAVFSGDVTAENITAIAQVNAATLDATGAITGASVAATGNVNGFDVIAAGGVAAQTVDAVGDISGANGTFGGDLVGNVGIISTALDLLLDGTHRGKIIEVTAAATITMPALTLGYNVQIVNKGGAVTLAGTVGAGTIIADANTGVTIYCNGVDFTAIGSLT